MPFSISLHKQVFAGQHDAAMAQAKAVFIVSLTATYVIIYLSLLLH
jgi:ABC-type sugar transport system permease subunit